MNTFQSSWSMHAAVALATLAGAGSGNAQSNLLVNASFENRTQVQTTQVRSCDAMSSAKGWTTWIQAIGCVPDSGVELVTDVILGPPGERFSRATYLMHVRTTPVNPFGMGDAGSSGIAQTFDPTGGLHTRVLASVWVFVVRGEVGMGVGYAGSTKASVRNSKLGEWEHLVGVNARDPATQLVVYGIDPAGSEFYIADAVVCPANTDEELAACRQLVEIDVHP